MPRMPTFKYQNVLEHEIKKPESIKNSRTKDFLRCAYAVAMRHGVRGSHFVSGVLNRDHQALKYEDDRVQILLDDADGRMEVVWKGADRVLHGYEDEGDNPVVMVSAGWILIRRHGETRIIEDHVIDLGRIRP